MQPDFGLSYDQQAELERLKRRREIAAALQDQSFTPRGVQMVGRIAVPRSRGEGIARLLAGLGSSYMEQQAGEQSTQLARTAAQEAQGEMSQLTGMDPKAAIAQALSSKYPGIRQTGGVWQGQQAQLERDAAKARAEMQQKEFEALQKRLQGSAETRTKAGDFSGALDTYATGGFQPGAVPAPKMPEVTRTPEGNEMVVNYDLPQNTAKGTLLGKPTQVTQTAEMRLPGDENRMALDAVQAELPKRQESADLAVRTLDAMRSAVQAAEEGAKVGGGGELFQTLRKVGDALGVPLPENAPVDQLQAALGQGVLEYARKLAPVTQEDVKRLQVILGSINTDPSALSKMLAITTAVQLRELQNFNRWHGDQLSATVSPAAQQRLAGANVGREMPKGLFGPIPWQYEVLKQFYDRGGDISQFRGIPPELLRDMTSGQVKINSNLFEGRNPAAAPGAPPPQQPLPPPPGVIVRNPGRRP